MQPSDLDAWHMARALELARQGQGHVEPNPMVGCVVAHGAEIVGEGWHRRFGGPHAEVEALAVAGPHARGATLYVTLEPCCHHGKTPPCTQAVIAAGIGRVVIAQLDPFPQVNGRGAAELRSAGLEVYDGVLADEARALNAPYLKRLATSRPWVIAKWAMTLDGRLATRSGHSQWISNDRSRAVAHGLRGRVDAVLVGRGTVEADDPLLTARPAGPRVATRVVLDSQGRLSSTSQLVRTAGDVPVIVATALDVPEREQARLTEAGCEVIPCAGAHPAARLRTLLAELGKRQMTNVLVEGGALLLGTLLDERLIDEVHVFIAPKLVGGTTAPGPIAGQGVGRMDEALTLDDARSETIDGDVYVSGRVAGASTSSASSAATTS